MSTYILTREGSVEFYAPDLSKYISGGRVEPAWAPVFYNPAMANNRSISVIVARAYVRYFGINGTLCEPFTGTGIRSIRYVKESNVERVIAGDIDDEAVKVAKMNVELNGLADLVKVVKSDANALMATTRCDMIDIDPYGSPAPFIGNAIVSIRDGGLLCVTATDLAVLQGSYVDKAMRRYGFRPIRGPISREVGLRGLLGFIARQALIYDAGIRPLLSYWEGHYYRLFMVVDKSRSAARETLKKLGYVYYCRSTLARGFLKESGGESARGCIVGGPLWIGELGDVDFIEYALSQALNTDYEAKASDTIRATLFDNTPIPLYYTADEVGRRIGYVPSVVRLISWLRSMGIDAYPTHFHNRGIKTDAEPWLLIQAARELMTSYR